MDDMAGKISELLNDPQGMEKVMSMAKALFSDGGNDAPQTSISQQEEKDGSDTLGGLQLPEGFDPIKLMNIFSALNGRQNDKRSALLLALKPHLSSDRQERVEKAVKLLKLASLIPVLKEQGILDMF